MVVNLVVNRVDRNCRGFGLLELLVAVVIGSMILLALNSLVGLASRAGAEGRASNELTYQGRFALERMVDKARATAPTQLLTPTAGTTGNWFAPTMYCRNATSSQLIETTTSDTSCAGTAVIANNVSVFSATLPTGMGPLDRHTAVLSLTLADGQGHATTLVSQVRLGGGTK